MRIETLKLNSNQYPSNQ